MTTGSEREDAGATAALGPGPLADLTPRQRRHLLGRLRRVTPTSGGRNRDSALAVAVMLCALALVPWTVYLAFALPNAYRATDWGSTWVGFDVLLCAMLLATAWLTHRRRPMLVPVAFSTGILLFVDAWFDVMLAAPGDFRGSLLSAVVIEVPLGAFLSMSAVRTLQRYVALA